MMEILNIKQFVKKWKENIKEKISPNKLLVIIQIGDNEASNRYVRNKIKDCQEVGIHTQLRRLPESASTQDVIKTIEEYKLYPDCYIIVQQPVPPQVDLEKVKMAVPRDMDIDGLRPDSKFAACTPFGIIHYLNACGFPFEGAHALVLGRSDLVGKPMAKMLLEKNASVTICHSKSKEIEKYAAFADLVVVAVGKEGVFDARLAPKASILVDVGINFNEQGKMVGDIKNPDNRCTPVPGGVGLLTRCAILEQIAED